jgi:hypothetical protein
VPLVKGTTLTAEQRALRARAAAYALHAMGGTNTAPATAARLAADERAVDPDGILAPDERARRAALYRRSRMAVLALKSSRTRAQRKAAPAIVTPGAAGSEARRARGERPTTAA